MKQIHKCANEVSKLLLGMSSDVSFLVANRQMCDGDYKSVVWVQGVGQPLVGFTLVPHGGDEQEGLTQ